MRRGQMEIWIENNSKVASEMCKLPAFQARDFGIDSHTMKLLHNNGGLKRLIRSQHGNTWSVTEIFRQRVKGE